MPIRQAIKALDKDRQISAQERADIKEGLDAYLELRPSRKRVYEAMLKLLAVSPYQVKVLMGIFTDKVSSGDWPPDEVRRKPNFVDPRGVEFFHPRSAIYHQGEVRSSWRSCDECDGNGWHHYRYPSGKETVSRCQSCSTAYANYLRKNRGPKKKEDEWRE